MKIGRIEIKARRWPWQSNKTPNWSHNRTPGTKWGWSKLPGMGRFGGGWDYKLGFAFSISTPESGCWKLMIDLVLGFITIARVKKSEPAPLKQEVV